MKYLLPLLFLVGCESFPEKKEEPEYIEMPIIDTHVEDGIKIAPYDEEERIEVRTQIGSFDFFLKDSILEIDIVSITGRRFMIYIDVIGG
ncbi:MAG TPA: hypothetical protein EYO59_07025 [Chromatiaceae bacterium]|nr:hypothetical protein [Chromatiaceae bacterium]